MGKIFFDLLGATFGALISAQQVRVRHYPRCALLLESLGASLAEMDEAAALELVVKMLETAAEYDTATGGYRETPISSPQ